MIRHTNKNKRLFGILFGIAVLGLTAVVANVNAKDAKETVDVQFTFNSTIGLTVSADTMSITGLTPNQTGESEPITLTVDTNSAAGFYLSATAGGENTDLTGSTGGKFTSMATNANTDLASAGNETWGFAYANDDSALANSKFNGLPLDQGKQASVGTKLIDANNLSANKTIKCKIGAKAGPTTPAGTYQNVINFYVVAK